MNNLHEQERHELLNEQNYTLIFSHIKKHCHDA
jgi:hypothetical protein